MNSTKIVGDSSYAACRLMCGKPAAFRLMFLFTRRRG